MNKKNKFYPATLAALLGTAIWIPGAHAAFIVDTKIGESLLGSSGDGTELAEMESFANNNNLIQDLKIESFTAFENDLGQWYLDVAQPSRVISF
jgi:hypothetical protein